MATVVNNQDTPPVNLQCQYCSNNYNDPRILACLHSFCLQCLARLYEEDDVTNDSFITCPTCNHRTALPAEGDVASIPINVHLSYKVEQNNIAMKVLAESPPPSCEGCEDEGSSTTTYCNDCNDMLCDDCWMMHKKQKTTKSHSVFRLDDLRKKPRAELVKMVGPSVDSIPNCQYHPNQKLIFYCHADSCRIPVCVECVIIRHDQTNGHVVSEVDETHVQQLTTDLKQNVNELKGNKETLEGVLQQIEETKQKVQTRKNKVDGRICRTFDNLRRMIDQREKELLKENAKIASSKNKRLSQQQKGIQRMLQSINDCISITSSATDEYSNVQLLAIANALDNRANDLQQQYINTHLDLVDTPDIDVNVDSVITTDFIGKYGSVTDPSANGLQCSAILPSRRLGLQMTMKVEVTTRNIQGKLLNASCERTKVKATLLSDGKIVKNSLTVIDKKNGKYHVNVRGDQVGEHQLSIAINGEDVKGSPFDLTIVRKRDYAQLAKPVRTISGIDKPKYIAFSDNGDMFVTSSGDHRIHVYDMKGNKKTTIGSGRWNGPKQFKSPYGIDIHGDIIYVAEYGNHNIHQITINGEFIRTFGEKGSAPGQFNCPHDVKISPTDGKVYVADTNNDRVQVFNPDWTFSHVIDGTVKGDGCFSAPKGIAFDLLGNVVISAYGSSSVLVFTAQGIFIREFLDVYSPTGIAIDASGYYLINSYDNTRFVINNTSGKSVRVINGISAGYGVAVSPYDQSVWVADPWNNKLFKY